MIAYTAYNNAEWPFMTELLQRKGLQWLLNSTSLHCSQPFYVTDTAGAVIFEYRLAA